MELFAIRHKPTGFYLGDPKGRGGSFMEPEPATAIRPPRIFHNRHAAACALGQWLLGHHVKHSCSGGQTPYGDFDDYEEWTTYEAQPHRKREEMEVVPIQLVLPA